LRRSCLDTTGTYMVMNAVAGGGNNAAGMLVVEPR
jgi:hypothetical protein